MPETDSYFAKKKKNIHTQILTLFPSIILLKYRRESFKTISISLYRTFTFAISHTIFSRTTYYVYVKHNNSKFYINILIRAARKEKKRQSQNNSIDLKLRSIRLFPLLSIYFFVSDYILTSINSIYSLCIRKYNNKKILSKLCYTHPRMKEKKYQTTVHPSKIFIFLKGTIKNFQFE